MFKKSRLKGAAGRLLEERIYEQVAEELNRGEKRSGLWAKALSNCDGSPEKVEAIYIRYRVQSIKDEAAVKAVVQEEEAARELEQERLFAETDKMRILQERISVACSTIRSAGLRVTQKDKYWVIKNPTIQQQQKVRSLKELESFAKRVASS